MSKVINWGVLGAAKFARDHMAPAIHSARGARLAGLATSAPENAEPFQAFQPDLQVFDSYETLLGDPDIDAVYIPLPNHLHVEWVLNALDAGKHVLCEKPLAMEAGQFDAVIRKRDDTGLMVAEAFMIPHHPQWQQARALVQSGAIGDVMLVDGVFTYDNSGDPHNIRNRPETGGGSLPDIGVYTIGGARFVTGQEPFVVHPYIRRENGVDVFAQVTAGFPDFQFSSVTSMRMAPRQEMTFHGSKGVLRLSCPFNAGVFDQAELTLEHGDKRVEHWRWPGINQYVLQVEAFGRAIEGEDGYACPLEFSKGTQKVLDMIWDAEKRT